MRIAEYYSRKRIVVGFLVLTISICSDDINKRRLGFAEGKQRSSSTISVVRDKDADIIHGWTQQCSDIKATYYGTGSRSCKCEYGRTFYHDSNGKLYCYMHYGQKADCNIYIDRTYRKVLLIDLDENPKLEIGTLSLNTSDFRAISGCNYSIPSIHVWDFTRDHGTWARFRRADFKLSTSYTTNLEWKSVPESSAYQGLLLKLSVKELCVPERSKVYCLLLKIKGNRSYPLHFQSSTSATSFWISPSFSTIADLTNGLPSSHARSMTVFTITPTTLLSSAVKSSSSFMTEIKSIATTQLRSSVKLKATTGVFPSSTSLKIKVTSSVSSPVALTTKLDTPEQSSSTMVTENPIVKSSITTIISPYSSDAVTMKLNPSSPHLSHTIRKITNSLEIESSATTLQMASSTSPPIIDGKQKKRQSDVTTITAAAAGGGVFGVLVTLICIIGLCRRQRRKTENSPGRKESGKEELYVASIEDNLPVSVSNRSNDNRNKLGKGLDNPTYNSNSMVLGTLRKENVIPRRGTSTSPQNEDYDYADSEFNPPNRQSHYEPLAYDPAVNAVYESYNDQTERAPSPLYRVLDDDADNIREPRSQSPIYQVPDGNQEGHSSPPGTASKSSALHHQLKDAPKSYRQSRVLDDDVRREIRADSPMYEQVNPDKIGNQPLDEADGSFSQLSPFRRSSLQDKYEKLDISRTDLDKHSSFYQPLDKELKAPVEQSAAPEDPTYRVIDELSDNEPIYRELDDAMNDQNNSNSDPVYRELDDAVGDQNNTNCEPVYRELDHEASGQTNTGLVNANYIDEYEI